MSLLTQDFSKLLEAVVETAGREAGDSLREPIAELRQRLSLIERRLAILENVERDAHSAEFDPLARSAERICQACDRRAIARSLCSAHYQQWRYRQKKAKLRSILGEKTAAREAASSGFAAAELHKIPTGATGAVLNDDTNAQQLDA